MPSNKNISPFFKTKLEQSWKYPCETKSGSLKELQWRGPWYSIISVRLKFIKESLNKQKRHKHSSLFPGVWLRKNNNLVQEHRLPLKRQLVKPAGDRTGELEAVVRRLCSPQQAQERWTPCWEHPAPHGCQDTAARSTISGHGQKFSFLAGCCGSDWWVKVHSYRHQTQSNMKAAF